MGKLADGGEKKPLYPTHAKMLERLVELLTRPG